MVVPTSSSTCVDYQTPEDEVWQLVDSKTEPHVACETGACTRSMSSDAVKQLESLSKSADK